MVLSAADARRGLSAADARGFGQLVRAQGGFRKKFFAESAFHSKTNVTISVQGLRALNQHWDTYVAMVPPLVREINKETGRQVQARARELVPVDTGRTRRSIHPTTYATADGFGVDIGPTTFYSRFLEFGTVYMRPRPFMIPAATAFEAAYISAMIDVAKIADQLVQMNQPYASAAGVREVIQRHRAGLYTLEKALGDIQVFTGLPLGGFRSALLVGAGGLGDLQAAMRGAIGTRVTRRLQGKVTGRLIGVGSVSLSHSQTYSAQVGGTTSQRIYQRLAGRAVGRLAR